jgi:hypothetical protein
MAPDDETAVSLMKTAMPGKALRMIDRIDVFQPRGGPHALGYIRASKDVDPDEWFFKAHFFRIRFARVLWAWNLCINCSNISPFTYGEMRMIIRWSIACEQ